MKLEINGMHIFAAAASLVIWIFILPFWPSIFIFVIGQVATSVIGKIVYDITSGASE